MAEKEKDLEEFAITTEKNLVRAAKLIALVLADKSTAYAPIGWTGQLKRSIKAKAPVIEKHRIFSRVVSFAADKDGNNYAAKQHDDILHHAFSKGKLSAGFMEFGEGPTKEIRYWDGYRNHPNPPSYKTEFFIQGFNESKPQIDKIMDSI